jgi:hypothetical protein
MKSENYHANSMSRADGSIKLVRQTDHVDVSRPLEQPPAILWKYFPVPSYVPLCNMSSNRRDTRKEIERTPIQINMTIILMKLMNDASAINFKLDEFETETDGPDTHS